MCTPPLLFKLEFITDKFCVSKLSGDEETDKLPGIFED
jgi:hypothetical protein